MTTTMATTTIQTQATGDSSPARPGFRLSNATRPVQLGHDARDVVGEAAKRAEERDQLLRTRELAVAERPAAGDLEGPPAAVREEPGHHPRIDEGGREALLLARHLERPLELLGLEGDLMLQDAAGGASERVLGADRDRPTPGGDLRD